MIRRTVATALGGLAAAVLADRWLGGLSLDEEGRPIRVPIRSRVEIDAPIGDVWARIADVERQPEWMTDLKAVRLVTAGPIGVGTRAEGTVRILGIPIDDPVEIVEFQPPHRFAIRHAGRFGGSGLITLDTLDGGRRDEAQCPRRHVRPIPRNRRSVDESSRAERSPRHAVQDPPVLGVLAAGARADRRSRDLRAAR